MKRILAVVLALLMLIPRGVAYAIGETAGSVCLINAVTGEVVYEKNATEKRSMASTTKIMTLVVALENSEMDEVVTVPVEATLEEGSSAYLRPQAKITMKDLLHGLMLNSGNDAAVAVAYHISGNVEDFARLMTDTAHRIGADNTQFINPNGLEAEGHYTTARDLVLITQYALSLDGFKDIVSKRTYTGVITMPDGSILEIPYTNHNRLLGELEGCIGVKTGFTKAAGRCLVTAVDNNGAQYIAVTLNDADDWNTHKALYEYAYTEQREKTIIKKGDCIRHAVCGNDTAELIAASDYSVYLNKSDPRNFQVEICVPKDIDFPLNKGEKVGYVSVLSNNREIGRVDVIAKKEFNPKKEAKVKNCYYFTVLTLLRNFL